MSIQPSNFKHKKVAVIGAGVEGLAVAGYLDKVGASIEIRDKKTSDALSTENDQFPHPSHFGGNEGYGGQAISNFQFKGGEGYLEDLNQFDLIVRSPGVPWLTPELERAREAGVTVTSQTELFMLACPCPVIGVTGTKGKSTTAALIAHILDYTGKKVRLGGNIGEPIIHWLDDLTPDEFVVLELSSFQLQGLSVSPHVAVVLDIGTEHLDYHRTRDEYVEAKRSIVANQKSSDIAVIDADSLTAVAYAASTLAQTWWFSRKKFVDQGVYVKDIAGEPWFDSRTDEGEALIAPVSDVRLNGDHYFSNIAAAATACLALEVDAEVIGEAVRTFDGLPHRMQNLGQFAGRLWIDDSYATAPDATVAALEACRDMSCVLMVGGSSKGYGFEALADAILSNQPKAVVYIGQTGHEIKQTTLALAGQKKVPAPPFVEGGTTMPEMINHAMAASRSGDTILFSPASASFGLFANAKDRASQFVIAVESLKEGTDATA